MKVKEHSAPEVYWKKVRMNLLAGLPMWPSQSQNVKEELCRLADDCAICFLCFPPLDRKQIRYSKAELHFSNKLFDFMVKFPFLLLPAPSLSKHFIYKFSVLQKIMRSSAFEPAPFASILVLLKSCDMLSHCFI